METLSTEARELPHICVFLWFADCSIRYLSSVLIPASIRDRAPITNSVSFGYAEAIGDCGYVHEMSKRSLCLLLLHTAVLAFPTFQLCMERSRIQCSVSTLYTLVKEC
jgi:hypothetical protein